MTLGEKIELARSAANLNRTELAEKIGMTRRAVEHWEKNTRNPDFTTIVKIAEATQLPLDYFAP